MGAKEERDENKIYIKLRNWEGEQGEVEVSLEALTAKNPKRIAVQGKIGRRMAIRKKQN